MEDKIYVAIDLKSFYASCECVDRQLDPLTTNLVVADASRTNKTICLAVSPGLKKYGIPGRPRLFEVEKLVKEINFSRKTKALNHQFIAKSISTIELDSNASLELDYVIAPPRMGHYIEVSSKIYSIYLKYFSPDDIHVYSIDEVFIDVTGYLKLYNKTPELLVRDIILEIYHTTGITATCGIGTNLYLAKIAMDIVAKHKEADQYGVRIAFLNEQLYKEQLWNHTPLTDFWRIGGGIARRLNAHNLYTMGDIALLSTQDEDYFYEEFGVNGELIIDHAWGYEPCTIKEIKSYVPLNNSLGQGQVLHEPYAYLDAKLIIKEMADVLALDLVDKNLVTDQIVISIGYDKDNLENTEIINNYQGEVVMDYLGRKIPKGSHGSINLPFFCSSSKIILEYTTYLFDHIVNQNLLVRRLNICANHIKKESDVHQGHYQQLNLFSDVNKIEEQNKKMQNELKNENKLQKTIIDIQKKYGKNSVLKGMNYQEKATTKERNKQIGGHKA